MTGPALFHLGWPVAGYVTAETIETWYAEAVGQGVVSIAAGRAKTPEQMARALSNAGRIFELTGHVPPALASVNVNPTRANGD